MSRNPPPFGDALSVEEHVLGCMCDSFRSYHEQAQKQKNNPPVSMIRTDEYGRGDSIYYLKNKTISHIPPLCMNFMVSIGANPIMMRNNSPLVTNGYPLSGEIFI